MTIGCIVLAAGAGARFGGGKLAAILGGKPVIEYILGPIREARFSERVIVAANEAMLDTARRYGMGGVINGLPELGVSRSIRMGLEFMAETDACMFCVADHPRSTRETRDALRLSYEPDTILMVSYKGQTGNPVIYPASLYDELRSLTGEESGKTVACRHDDLLRLFHVTDASQLADIDTREDLIAMEACLSGPPNRI